MANSAALPAVHFSALVRHSLENPICLRLHKWPNHILLWTLCLLNSLHYMDRFIVAALLPIIKKDFGLSDVSSSLLHTSFILAYTCFYVAFAFIAPYFPAKHVLLFACTSWLVLAISSTLASRYWLLLHLRMLAAGCEACFAAVAPLLFMQITWKHALSRARWLLIFCCSTPLGSGLGYLASAIILKLCPAYSWRICLGVVPALLCPALCALYCRHNALISNKQKKPQQEQENTPALGKQLRQLFQIRSYTLACAGYVCAQFISTTINWWLPSYLYRCFQHCQLYEIIFQLGCLNALTSLFGVLLGSSLSNWAHHHNRKVLDPVLCAGSILLSLPCLLLMIYFATFNKLLTFFFASVSHLTLNIYPMLALDMLLYVVPFKRRMLAYMVHILLVLVCAEATGPFSVGLLAQLFQYFKQPLHSSLQYALLLVICVHLFGSILFFCATFFIARDRLRIKSLPAASHTFVTRRSLLEWSVGRRQTMR